MVRKEYTNGEITIVWKPEKCIHSANCVKGLPAVFDNTRKPWIDPQAADSQAIINQVAKCPSGALSIQTSDAPVDKTSAIRLEVLPDGPVMVHGPVTITRPDGSVEERGPKTALCRCGASGNKPFCDGSHRKVGFSG